MVSDVCEGLQCFPLFISVGSLLNIKDAYSHPLFYRGIDDSTGFKTRLVEMKLSDSFILAVVVVMAVWGLLP